MMKLLGIEVAVTSKNTITFWWRKTTRCINITSFKKIRAKNRVDYPDDPDVNVNREWGIITNGARKGNPADSCLDLTIKLGHIEINYINWTYNEKIRRKQSKNTNAYIGEDVTR